LIPLDAGQDQQNSQIHRRLRLLMSQIIAAPRFRVPIGEGLRRFGVFPTGPAPLLCGCIQSGRCPETIWTGTQQGLPPEISVTGEVAASNLAEVTSQEGTSIPIPIACALSDRMTRTREQGARGTAHGHRARRTPPYSSAVYYRLIHGRIDLECQL
jgi:hypothetical protein